ncbi:kinase-like domain-containing protein [Nemania sp. FL0031]|nr:kinase-like domain-containing protein [Nemania sp. FL0031]
MTNSDISFDSSFKPARSLGSGTFGEVLKVEREYDQQKEAFALKSFFAKTKPAVFQNEIAILKALAQVPHDHIMYFLSARTNNDGVPEILFPCAHGDLGGSLMDSPLKPPADMASGLLRQILGVCDAIGYLHHHIVPDENSRGTRRVGFHHNLKPSNILLFGSNEPSMAIWKLGDFGSGAIEYHDLSSTELPYADKRASPACPEYSAPEFFTGGKALQPADIWSLGCIFLEVLVWAFALRADPVTYFREERQRSCRGHKVPGPVFWCQDRQGRTYLNKAVLNEWSILQYGSAEIYGSILANMAKMLELSPDARINAFDLCEQLRLVVVRVEI